MRQTISQETKNNLPPVLTRAQVTYYRLPHTPKVSFLTKLINLWHSAMAEGEQNQ